MPCLAEQPHNLRSLQIQLFPNMSHPTSLKPVCKMQQSPVTSFCNPQTIASWNALGWKRCSPSPPPGHLDPSVLLFPQRSLKLTSLFIMQDKLSTHFTALHISNAQVLLGAGSGRTELINLKMLVQNIIFLTELMQNIQ